MMGAIVGSMGAVVSSMGAVMGSMGAVVGLMEVNIGYGDSIPTRLCLKKDVFSSPQFERPSEKIQTRNTAKVGGIGSKIQIISPHKHTMYVSLGMNYCMDPLGRSILQLLYYLTNFVFKFFCMIYSSFSA